MGIVDSGGDDGSYGYGMGMVMVPADRHRRPAAAAATARGCGGLRIADVRTFDPSSKLSSLDRKKKTMTMTSGGTIVNTADLSGRL